MKESAMGEKVKMMTLMQEVIRRLRNTSREAEDSEREEVLTKFAVKMWRSGYREYSRKMVLLTRIKGYRRQLELNDRGARVRNITLVFPQPKPRFTNF